jgi:hypothetical protein
MAAATCRRLASWTSMAYSDLRISSWNSVSSVWHCKAYLRGLHHIEGSSCPSNKRGIKADEDGWPWFTGSRLFPKVNLGRTRY